MIKKNALPTKLTIYDKVFNLHFDPKLEAYYNLSLYKYSEELHKDLFICHIVLLSPFKLTNYKYIYEVEDKALRELFSLNPNFNPQTSIFTLIIEMTEGAKFAPDLRLIRNIIKLKSDIQTKRGVLLNHAVAIIPKKFKKTYSVFKTAARFLAKDEKYGMIVNTYQEALDAIDKIDFIINEKDIVELFA